MDRPRTAGQRGGRVGGAGREGGLRRALGDPRLQPWKRRWLLRRRTDLASGVHTIALQTIERWYAAAGAAPKTGRTGSVTATQRLGSDDRLSFRRVVQHSEDIERLVVRIAEACETWLSRKGFGAEDEGDAAERDDTQAVIQQASLLGQAALGERAGTRARRVQVLGGDGACASAPVRELRRVQPARRCGLQGHRPRRPRAANQVIYRGVLAGNAAWRAEVVPSPPPESPETAKARRAKRLTRHPRMRLAGERPSWSDLLERVFRVDGFACPGCGGPLTLRCLVLNRRATRRIRDGLRRATGLPGLDAGGDDRTA